MNILRLMVDETHTLRDTALLVRRAGLEHLVVNPSPSEVLALADAGDALAMERVAYLVAALRDPARALSPFDGGALARAETKAVAYALSRKN